MVAMPIDPYILSSELITGIFGTLKLTKKNNNSVGYIVNL